MWSLHEKGLSGAQQANLATAKKAFSLLDDSVEFDRVDPTTFDILVKTKQGSIYLEYLSSGYKSCLCLIIGLIKEIEYRNLSPSIEVGNFSGVVVIDELDLHLHPEWQAKLIPMLKKVFPMAQFIAATHSPHMLQAAEPQEVIALQFDSEGNVVLHEIPSTSGFQGWTIEEILSDVMDMTDLRTRRFRELVETFGAAIDREDVAAATETYSALDKFLHPKNELRKLFRLQLAGIASTPPND